MADLKHYIKSINEAFKKESDRYKAHALCKPLLIEMAENKSIFFEIIKKNIHLPKINSDKCMKYKELI